MRQGAQTKDKTIQFLVLKSLREPLFHVSHHNPMAGHMWQEKPLNQLMAHFYWLGITMMFVLQMSAGESVEHPKSPITATAINQCPLQKNWHGPRRAIGSNCMGASLCASVCALLVQ